MLDLVFLMRLPVSKNETFLKCGVRLLDLALLISFTHFLIKLLDLVNIKHAFANFSYCDVSQIGRTGICFALSYGGC